MYHGFINPNADDKAIYDHFRAVVRKLPRNKGMNQLQLHQEAYRIVAERRNITAVQVEQIHRDHH